LAVLHKNAETMLTEHNARAIAADWITAWNNHDIQAIMHHYADEITFTSPFVTRLNNDPFGTITSKPALQQYFERALSAYPDLEFELYHVLSSVNSVVLYYKSVNNLLAAEFMLLNNEGKVHQVYAHYTPSS
jgi:hypothetical protein